jgi:hypothetical protein
VPLYDNDRLSMTKTKEIKVTINIKPGKATPAQLKAWRAFWRRLLIKAKY